MKCSHQNVISEKFLFGTSKSVGMPTDGRYLPCAKCQARQELIVHVEPLLTRSEVDAWRKKYTRQ
jgi:hypothetical protein